MDIDDLSPNSTYDYSQSCGVNNCPLTPLPEETSNPTLSSVYILCGTINAACLLSIIIALLFVDDVKYDENLNPVERGRVDFKKISNYFFKFSSLNI